MKFLLTGGNHRIGDKTYHDGDIINTHLQLDKIFERTKKFTRVTHHSPKGDGGALPPEPVNITSLVEPDLHDKGLKIVQKGAWFYVVDEVTENTLNEKGLRRNEIPEFVKQYTEN